MIFKCTLQHVADIPAKSCKGVVVECIAMPDAQQCSKLAALDLPVALVLPTGQTGNDPRFFYGPAVAQAEALLLSLVNNRSIDQIRAIMHSLDNAGRLPRDRALTEETRLFFALALQAAKTEPV